MANNQLYKKLLERLLQDRPDLAQYAEVLNQDDEEVDDSSPLRIQELENKLRKMQVGRARMEQDLNDTLDELEELAKALGACTECWGEDSRCPQCHGKGRSGFREPDRSLFDRLVYPALRKAPWLEVKELTSS